MVEKNIFRFLFKKKTKPLVNILTRTSNRPNGFKLCHNSIKNQTYLNVRHIVSSDSPEDLNYLKEYNVDKIKVCREQSFSEIKSETEFKPYNLFCNDLLKVVEEGWIIFLDDDDMLANRNVLKQIVYYIEKNDEDTMFFFQTRFPNGKLRPPDLLFKKEEIKYTQIDTACFLFHSKYKNAAKWDCWRGADFRFIEDLSKIIPKQKWIRKTFTLKNNFGDHGNRNDLADNFEPFEVN